MNPHSLPLQGRQAKRRLHTLINNFSSQLNKMAYADNTSKTVIVVNSEFPGPTIINAVAHAVLGLIGANNRDAWKLLAYPSPAFSSESHISEFPAIVLRAKRSSALEKLICALRDTGIPHNIFIDSMIGASAESQRAATLAATPEHNKVICVALFGREEAIRPLIKSFSLYKESETSHVVPAE